MVVCMMMLRRSIYIDSHPPSHVYTLAPHARPHNNNHCHITTKKNQHPTNRTAGQILRRHNVTVDEVHTSLLKRSVKTACLILEVRFGGSLMWYGRSVGVNERGSCLLGV